MKKKKLDQVEKGPVLSTEENGSSVSSGTNSPLSVAPGTHPVPGTGGTLSVAPGTHPVPAEDEEESAQAAANGL